MIQRIWELSRYFAQNLAFSLAGLVLVILSFLFWAIFFPPSQGTPDIENYVMIIAAFGVTLTFVATLTVTSRASRAENFPLIARLPSRIEYMTAVFSAAMIFALLLQLMVALLALIRGPDASIGRLLEAPPVWIALDLLAAIMALHASDLIASGWSRVMIYGTLAILLIAQSFAERLNTWFIAIISNVSSYFYGQQMNGVADSLGRITAWLSGSEQSLLDRFLGFVFWPFKAIESAVLGGAFSPTEALAPAVLVLYATILYLLAADLFASKDLELIE
ncbi:MAG: hypothetical protein ACK2UK_02955 [Candidatus Promineifilaceae bacterium]